MLTTISATLTAFSTATTLTKAAIAARNDELIDKALRELVDRYIDVQNACLSLQEKNFSMSNENRELSERLRKQEEKMADLAGYQLHRTTGGGLAYIAKASLEPGQTPVYICANCANHGEKTYLQPARGGYLLHCTKHGDVPSDKQKPKTGNTIRVAGRLASW